MNAAIGLGILLLFVGGAGLVVWRVLSKIDLTPDNAEQPLQKSTALKATEAYYTLMEQLVRNGHEEAADKLRIEIMPCVLDMQPVDNAIKTDLKGLLPEGGKA